MPVSSKPPKAEASNRSMVVVVDDDADLRDALSNLFQSVGMEVSIFGSAPELLRAKLPEVPSCLVLDIRLPGTSGLDFQGQLGKLGIDLPIVFMTGHGDIPMSVRAIKSGAIEFLTKPLNEQELLDAVQAGLARDRGRREEGKIVAELHARFEHLTPREREILSLIVTGRPNKQIAAEVGLSEMTVKVHRSHVMQKMRANSVVELVRMVDQLGLSDQESGGTIPTA